MSERLPGRGSRADGAQPLSERLLVGLLRRRHGNVPEVQRSLLPVQRERDELRAVPLPEVAAGLRVREQVRNRVRAAAHDERVRSLRCELSHMLRDARVAMLLLRVGHVLPRGPVPRRLSERLLRGRDDVALHCVRLRVRRLLLGDGLHDLRGVLLPAAERLVHIGVRRKLLRERCRALLRRLLGRLSRLLDGSVEQVPAVRERTGAARGRHLLGVVSLDAVRRARRLRRLPPVLSDVQRAHGRGLPQLRRRRARARVRARGLSRAVRDDLGVP